LLASRCLNYFVNSTITINPAHSEGASGNIIPLNLPDDNNSGSLVVKLQIREHSAILSGNATGTTTTHIIDNYSKVDPLFLKSSVEASSHHGAFTHKSNSKAWIKSIERRSRKISMAGAAREITGGSLLCFVDMPFQKCKIDFLPLHCKNIAFTNFK
jgi:hypothetical protein